MTCRHAETQLNALADRELNSWQASCVRRHLAACPACAAEYAGIQRLDATVQEWRDIPAPSGLGSRIAAALPPTAAFQASRRAFPLRPAAVGMAGVVAAVAAAAWFLPGQPGEPTIAFADVEKAMQRVQQISYRTVQYSPPNRLYRDDRYAFREWDRRNPLAIANSDTVTTDPANYSSSIQTSQGQFIRTAKGEYRMHPYQAVDRKCFQEGVEGAFRVFTQQPVLQHFDNGYDYNIVAKPEQRLVTFRGQRRILFTFNEDTVFRPSKSTPGIIDHSQCRVWVDPATRLVVRRETVNWNDTVPGHDPDIPRIVVNDDFHYNQVPPPGVFDWPPRGATVTKF